MNNNLFDDHVYLVYKIVNKMDYGYVDKEDLLQAGLIGLFKATKKFNKNINNNFISFSSIYIISEIKNILQAADLNGLPDFIKMYEADERAGVQSLLSKARKKMADYEKEVARTEKMKAFEKEYASYYYICGIDEVGRGPLAGPVVAGAVILPKDCDIL